MNSLIQGRRRGISADASKVAILVSSSAKQLETSDASSVQLGEYDFVIAGGGQ